MYKRRLDYIGNFKEGASEKMSGIREEFLDLENKIIELHKLSPLESKESRNVFRCFNEALSHLEKSQLYVIKLLCLIYEQE